MKSPACRGFFMTIFRFLPLSSRQRGLQVPRSLLEGKPASSGLSFFCVWRRVIAATTLQPLPHFPVTMSRPMPFAHFPRRLAFSQAVLLLVLVLAPCQAALARDAACAPIVQAPQPVPAARAGEASLATQNLHRLFDDIDSPKAPLVEPAEYRERLQRLSAQVVDVLRLPQVLAVQEVENEKVLADLAAAVVGRPGGRRYRAIVLEGHDSGGIDVGFLVREDLQVLAVEQVLARERLGRAFLFDRPPLRLRVRLADGDTLDLVNVHLKSLRGRNRSAKEVQRVARKREAQAEALGAWVRGQLRQRPGLRLVVLGDFNATPEGVGGVDVLGRLRAAGLDNPLARLPSSDRYTFVYDCRGLALDHVLLSPALVPKLGGLAISRGNAGASRRREERPSALGSSDHDAVVAYLRR